MRNSPGMVPPHPANVPWADNPYRDYLSHSAGQRVQTASVELKAIRGKYPDRHLTILTPYTFNNGMPVVCELLAYAAAGHAEATLNPEASEIIIERGFVPPARRHGGGEGSSVEEVRFAAYDYRYNGITYLLYYFHATEGMSSYKAQFLLSPPGSVKGEGEVDEKVAALIAAATTWGQQSHEEAWVFNLGYWTKDKDFYKSIHKSSWDDVILDKEKKQAIIDDVEGFFSSEESYNEFSVPWKRGIIFYGPPGNGKTISIKALMNNLSRRTKPGVELLYVKSFNNWQGPEYGILAVFTKARQMAPCILIFEDIDSMVNPMIRSYFLNAVDGLESNHGILMIGSTNHLERLDPGIAKRPSRFDRKYLFDLPTRDERAQYAQYWRHKLADNKKIDFPEVMCGMIADITDKFSFAYLKEAFVAALLAIVVSKDSSDPNPNPAPASPNTSFDILSSNQKYIDMVLLQRGLRTDLSPVFEMGGGDDDGGDDGRKQAEKSLLWKEIKKQIEILRREMDNDSDSDSNKNSANENNATTTTTINNNTSEWPSAANPSDRFPEFRARFADDLAGITAPTPPPVSGHPQTLRFRQGPYYGDDFWKN